MNNIIIDEHIAAKVLSTVDRGLVCGLGIPKPGEMCVEAAVCYAMGLPHSDNPSCVGNAVRNFKIRLNDLQWSSNKARALGMRKLAIAQLGSDTICQESFAKIVAYETIKQIVPIALRGAALRHPHHANTLELAALRCERAGDIAAAKNARLAANAAFATDAAFAAVAAVAADDAADAADNAAFAAAAAAGSAAATDDADLVLNCAANIGLSALIKLKSPGCAFLYLTES